LQDCSSTGSAIQPGSCSRAWMRRSIASQKTVRRYCLDASKRICWSASVWVGNSLLPAG
jgi:hypothetical protein